MFDPSLGRWLTEDPIGFKEATRTCIVSWGITPRTRPTQAVCEKSLHGVGHRFNAQQPR